MAYEMPRISERREVVNTLEVVTSEVETQLMLQFIMGISRIELLEMEGEEQNAGELTK